MAFKLRYRPLPGIAHGGNIKNKFKFKVEHKDLDDDIVAEAVSKDKIVIDEDVPKDSRLYNSWICSLCPYGNGDACGHCVWSNR